uniref:Small cysteine-rich protein 3b n=1 Tax=Orbicella faveolata TaxID=48498 RepID=C1KIZ2_ORBFA|nr:small cysteine-rich protein 3b [Orbicella faveolata]
MPVDCSEKFYCTLETNKCCCNEPPPTERPLCDLPHGTCYYHKDPCPDNMPVDCSQHFKCTLDTNKCCCY